MMTTDRVGFRHLIPAIKQAWHLNRGDLLAFGFAMAVVTVAGVIGSGPVWLVAALVSMQLVNVGRITYFRARGIAEADAFLAYLADMGVDLDNLDLPDGEAADL